MEQYRPYYNPPPVNPPPAGPPPVKQSSGRGRSIGAGFMYFGFYLAVNSVVSTAYVIALAILAIVRDGGLDVARLMSDIMNGSVLLSGITDLLTLMVYWIIFAKRRCRFSEETGLTRVNIARLLVIIPLGAACYVFVSCVLSLLPERWLESYAQSSVMLAGATGPLAILCVAVIAPFAEEVIFRGLMYSRFKRGMGKPLALLLASLIFGVMHGHPVWGAYAFLLSLLLCSVADWYGSLWASVLLHLCFNASEYVLSPLLEPLSVWPALVGSALLVVPLILLSWRLGTVGREKRLI